MGTANTVQVEVINAGWAAAGACQASLYDGNPATGGLLIDTEPLPTLSVGATTAIDLSWTPGATATYDLYVVVDSSGAVDQLLEDNNQTTYSVGVLAQPTLTLAPSSDSGIIGDGWTADPTPALTGTSATGVGIVVYVDSQQSALSWTTISDGTYSVTLPGLTNGPHTIWAQAYDSAGNPSPFSAPLSVIIDAEPLPTPDAPQLDPASDTGTSGDGVTNISRPRFTGLVKPFITVQLLDGGAVLGEATTAADPQFTFTPTDDLCSGSHQITVIQRDSNGNESFASAPLTIVIDTTAPTVTLSPRRLPTTVRLR